MEGSASTLLGPLAVYVHIPFCPSKCGYCDFNSYAMEGEIVDQTVEAIRKEIRESPHRGRPAHTVFFGGGTPTFLSADQLGSILAEVARSHPIGPRIEVTTEANPGTVDSAKFDKLLEAGFNRLSLGAQSFDTSDLLRLGRIHTPGEVGLAVSRARRAGFRKLNLDLMFGLPGQKFRGWKNNLELALSLETDHLSLYGLTIEQNTRFFRLSQRGLLDLPGDDAQIEMYEEAIRLCGIHQLTQYEISNFSRPGSECQHNIAYWRCLEYAGYGPGAVGCTGERGHRVRKTNLKGPKLYVEALQRGNDHVCDSENVDFSTQAIEDVMMGMRLNEGIDPAILNKNGQKELLTSGHIELERGRVRLTPTGRHVANLVIAKLLPDPPR